MLLDDDLPWAAPSACRPSSSVWLTCLVAVALVIAYGSLCWDGGLLIWLEDRGPVFYSQQRSGWLGRPFHGAKAAHDDVQTCHVQALLDTARRSTHHCSWDNGCVDCGFDELPQLAQCSQR